MRINKLFFLPLSAALLLTGCSGCSEEKKSEKLETVEEMLPPHLDFSANDSDAVVQLANEYLLAFSEKDYDAAADLLYRYENDTVRELTAKERNSYLKTMRQLPNFGSKLKSLILRTNNNNRLMYVLQVDPNGNMDEEQGVMKFFLNPVQKNGQWYLTLLDMEQEGTKDITR